jgi:hypothetical protein
VTEDGTVYLTDSPEGKLLVVPPMSRGPAVMFSHGWACEPPPHRW